MRRLPAVIALAALTGACATPSIPQAEPANGITFAPDYFADARPPAGEAELWWRGFDDPALDVLVETALERNQSLEAARQRLLAAEAIVRAEDADFLPTLDGEVAGSVGLDDSGDTFGGLDAGLGGSWVIDINGRLSAERAAALAAADGAAYFLADRRRIVAAAVADQYIELQRSGARLRLLDESTALQEQTLRIVTLRFEAGLSSNLDVRRAAADLARTRAQRGPLELARARSANAVSVLLGEPPSAIVRPSEEVRIPDYRGGPGIGFPAELLRRRPDLLLAESDVAVAAARVGIERADLLPALRLPGLISLGDGSISGILSQAVASLGAALDVPLFDGGRRRAEIAAAEAEYGASIADYRETLFTALAEVETALVAIRAAQDRKVELEAAVQESEAAFEQSNALYREGLASLFDVLDVQRQLISSREALIDGEADLSQAFIELYAAAGGGVASLQ